MNTDQEVWLAEAPHPFEGFWCGFCRQRLAASYANITIHADGPESAAIYYPTDHAQWAVIGWKSTGVSIEDPALGFLHRCGTRSVAHL